MKIREKIQQELNRRLNEVKEFENKELSSQDLAKTFFARIADYTQYTKTNTQLKQFISELQNKRKELQVGKELLEEGEDILKDLRKDFKSTNIFLKKNKINIPSIQVLFPPGFAGSVSTIGGIALDLQEIKTFLQSENQYIGELPKKVRALKSIIYRLKDIGEAKKPEHLEKMMEKYEQKLDQYEAKLRLHDIHISFLRLDDYEKLEQAWKLYYELDPASQLTLLKLELGQIISENVGLPYLDTQQLKLLKQLKTEYLLHLSRFNNYLVDRLEEKIWLEETLQWMWNNFGKSFVAVWLSLLFLWVLDTVGIRAPINAIRTLLIGN